VQDTAPKGADVAVFPMQADVYARATTEHVSAYVNLGYGGAARPVLHALSTRFVSREHYVMWREGATGWYARAGRFFPPYGLRLAEHTAYIRRFLGFNILEEPYALSGGYVSDEWELHLSAFIPDFVRADVGERGSGGVAYYERRVGTTIAYGGQAKLQVGDEDTRFMYGLVGKIFFEAPKIQLLAEADLVYQTFRHVDFNQWQMTGYLGAAWLPIRGWMFSLMLERWDEDLSLKGVARTAFDAEIQWFPYAHFEVSLYGRLQIIGSGGNDGATQKLVLLQLHYYL